MPLETYDGEVPRYLRDTEVHEADVDWDESWDASWNLESPGGGWGRTAFDEMPEASEMDMENVNNGTFKPIQYLAEAHPDLDNDLLHEYFADMNNAAQVEWKAKNLRQEMNWKQTNADAPFLMSAVTDTVSGVFSPSVALEVAGLAIGWGKLPLFGVKRAAIAAGYSLPATAMDEFMLRQQQDLRSGWQTGGALVGAAGITGLIGGLTGKRLAKINPDLSATPNTNVQPSAVLPESTVVPVSQGTSVTSGGSAQRIADISQDDLNAIMDIPTQTELDLEKQMRLEGKTFQERWGEDYDGPVTTELQRQNMILEKQGENFEVLRPTVVKVFGLGMHKLLPDVGAALSDNPVIRRLGGRIFNTNLTTKGSDVGKGVTSLDSVAMRGDTEIENTVQRVFGENYTSYSKNFTGDGKLNRSDFYREIQYSVAAGHKHDIPEVVKAGQELYEQTIDPLAKRAVKGGYLLDDGTGNPVKPLGDELYYTRSFSGGYARRVKPDTYASGLMGPYKAGLERRVVAESSESTRLLTELTEETLPQMKRDLDAAINKTPDKSDALRSQHKKDVGRLTREAKKTPLAKELEKLNDPTSKVYEKQYQRFIGMHQEIANDIRAAGMGEYSGSGVKMKEGALVMSKGRTLDIPTEFLPRDYLDPDAMMGIINTLKRQNRQLLAQEHPEAFGDAAFSQVFKDLQAHHFAKVEAATAKGKSTKKLDARYKKDAEFVTKMIKDFYGMKNPPSSEAISNLGQKAKAINAINGLGSVIVSTLPELAASLRSAGVRGYVRHTVGYLLDPKKMNNMKREVKADYVLGVEHSMGQRMLETGEYDSGMTTSTRMLHKASDFAVDKVYMLGVWTRAMSAQTGVMIQSKLGRMLLKANVEQVDSAGKQIAPRITGLSKKDIRSIGDMGLDIEMIPALKAEVEANHIKAWGGAVDMNVSKWTDTALRDKVVNAVASEVQNTIIRPGSGSTMFLGNSVGGSVLLQFKQFLMASTSKYWMADAQKFAMGDYRAFERQMAFAAMGTLVASMKSNYLYSESSRERWNDMEMSEKIWEGMKHGGGGGFAVELLGWAQEIMNPGSVRYGGNRNLLNQAIGPSFNLVYDALNTATGMSTLIKNGEISKEHLKSMRRNFPGNSYIFTRPAFNQLEGELYEDLNR